MPNGVGIALPPAKMLPSGAVWQAMQSPARARYSPRAKMFSLPGPAFCCARALEPTTSASTRKPRIRAQDRIAVSLSQIRFRTRRAARTRPSVPERR